MISVLVIHAPKVSGRCAWVATVRWPYGYNLHFSQFSCINARIHPISQSTQSVRPEKAVCLTSCDESRARWLYLLRVAVWVPAME